MRILLLAAALLGGEVDQLAARLEAEDPIERYRAAAALGALKAEARAAVPALVDLLADPEPWVRAEAGRALVRIGIGKEHARALIAHLEHADLDVGQMIAEALAALGRDGLPELLAALESEDRRTRLYALTAIRLAGRAAATAVPRLIAMTGDKDGAVSRRAAEGLRRIGPWAAPAVAELTDLLETGDDRTRFIAASVLGRIGPEARAAVPVLEGLLEGDSIRLREAASAALRTIDVVRKKAPDHPALLEPAQASEQAPAAFKVRFETTRGAFSVEVKREWAPRGADRFYNLVRIGYFTDVAVFRVLPGFVAQFGIHGDRKVIAAWQDAQIRDDEVKVANHRGWLTFATLGKDTRNVQIFVNLGNNGHLDGKGFAPVGRVVDGMPVVDGFFGGYRDEPAQKTMFYEGGAYLKREFPKLDYIRRARLVK